MPVVKRPMISFWICVVPSYRRFTRASRQKRSTGNSSEKPYPPWIWIAPSAARCAASDAKSFAMLVSLVLGSPLFLRSPARQSRSRAASVSTTMFCPFLAAKR